MPRLNKFYMVVVTATICSVWNVNMTEAQIVRKTLQNTVGVATKDIRETRRDYRLEKPFQYQPSDPWYRGKVFNTHTGHYGLFYNCDNEECKRNSPYICWKVHHERDFPKWKRPRYYIIQDLNKIRSRISNGGCAPHSPCRECEECVDNGNSIVRNVTADSQNLTKESGIASERSIGFHKHAYSQKRTSLRENGVSARNGLQNVDELNRPAENRQATNCSCPNCRKKR